MKFQEGLKRSYPGRMYTEETFRKLKEQEDAEDQAKSDALETEDWWVGHCGVCNAKFQIVRPGKSQPTCDCHLKCPCGSMQEYFGIGEHPDHLNVSGYYCRKCGPFPQFEETSDA